MITRCIHSNVFNTQVKHIAFAINTEGYNDAGFAGQVSGKYWPELAHCGYHELGTVLTKKVGDMTFHAMVCHSLNDGWGEPEEQRRIIKECFDKIPVKGQTIATIAIGTGFVGMMSGADHKQITYGMMDSNKKIYLHAGFRLNDIKNSYAKENARLELKKRLAEERGKAKTKNRKNG